MTDDSRALLNLIRKDSRYPMEAYRFVEEALVYAADSMELGSHIYCDPDLDSESDSPLAEREHHLTGQQYCEALRRYALNQFGYMAKVVLKSWNIDETRCFGDIVYNMIDGGIMKKSTRDRRAHFDEVYFFDDVFQSEFEICDSMSQRRT